MSDKSRQQEQFSTPSQESSSTYAYLRDLAEAARDAAPGGWYAPVTTPSFNVGQTDADFIAAVSPEVVLSLLDQIEGKS